MRIFGRVYNLAAGTMFLLLTGVCAYYTIIYQKPVDLLFAAAFLVFGDHSMEYFDKAFEG